MNDVFCLRECHATQYALASFNCITKCALWAHKDHPNDPIQDWVFEHGDRGKGDLEKLLGFVQEHAKRRLRQSQSTDPLKPLLPVFKHKSKDLSPLQAADFVAWEQRNALIKNVPVDQLRESLQLLLRVKHESGVVSRRSLLDYAERLGVFKRTVTLTQRQAGRWRPRIGGSV